MVTLWSIKKHLRTQKTGTLGRKEDWRHRKRERQGVEVGWRKERGEKGWKKGRRGGQSSGWDSLGHLFLHLVALSVTICTVSL